MFGEHLDPTRGIALNDEGLVIHGSILIGRAVGQHGVNDAQHLVRQGHDGLLVPLAVTSRPISDSPTQAIRG